MDAEKKLGNLIDNLNATLDSLGLYVVDVNLDLQGKDFYDSFEDIRDEIVNKKSYARFEVKCFSGKNAWREEFQEPILDYEIPELTVSDIQEYLEVLKDFNEE